VAPRSKVGRPTRPKVKTAEELDRELDVFMADDGKEAPVDSESKVVESVAAPQDVDMA
jgi:THO complex subunit 4